MKVIDERWNIGHYLSRYGAGLGVAGGVTAGAILGQYLETTLLGQPFIEAVALAIVLGMLVRNIWGHQARLVAGVDVAAKQGLEVAVVLLGASVNLPALLGAGPRLLGAVVLVVVGGITLSLLLSKMLGLNPKLAILIACGSSICGNSAIAAVAPAINAEREDIAASIGMTAVLGMVFVLVLPHLMPLFKFSQYQYGVLAGMTVYSVPQVLAATLPVSVLSGQIGTIVKLLRVLMLGPVVTFFALRYRRPSTTERFKIGRFVPWFIVGFVLLSIIRSLGLMPEGVADVLRNASRWLTVLAMAALGLLVDLRTIRTVGKPVTFAVVGSLGILIAISTGLIGVLGIGFGS